jgi:Tol biopolymer transport system component
MEPFISRDGKTLFFNSLNDGQDTSLYYAMRIDDITFQLVGEVGGVNGERPHLDGVASLDTKNNFYWISTRGYPSTVENLMTGTWDGSMVRDIRHVSGDFYNRAPGWIIMDAEISPDGETLYYVNAYFKPGKHVPSESKIGIAHKAVDSFLKDATSDMVLSEINKFTVVYAPSISDDGLQLLFTRTIPDKATELYLATRDSITSPFGEPRLVQIEGTLMEAGSFTLDAQTIYYHKKDGKSFRLFAMTQNNLEDKQ